jgi:hypothetical protein
MRIMPISGRRRIGTYHEGSLHAALKALYLRDGAVSEATVEGYVVDILYPGGAVAEIQTRGLSRLKSKLAALLPHRSVTLVYPVSVEKQLVVYDAGQEEVLRRRRSPRRQGLPDAFLELTGLARFLGHANLELHVLLVRDVEVRRCDGRGSWRRGGVTIVDRELVEIVERVRFRRAADYGRVLPAACPERFTNRQLAGLMDLPVRRVAPLTYCLRAAGVLEVHGRRGRENLLVRAR